MIKENLSLIKEKLFFTTKRPLFYHLMTHSRLSIENAIMLIAIVTICGALKFRKKKSTISAILICSAFLCKKIKFTKILNPNSKIAILNNIFNSESSIDYFSLPFIFLTIYFSSRNFLKTILLLSISFSLTNSLRFVFGIYCVFLVDWFQKSANYNFGKSLHKFLKIIFSIFFVPFFFFFAFYLQTFLRYSKYSIYYSNEFQQSLLNKPDIISDAYILDRSVVTLKGEMGYLGLEDNYSENISENNSIDGIGGNSNINNSNND